MGNSQFEVAKKIALDERNQMLAQQEKVIFQCAERLSIDARKAEKIGSLTVVEAVNELNEGNLTSEELLTALAFRTITLAKQLCLFTYLYFIEGRVLALACDQERANTKKRNLTLLDLQKVRSEEDKSKFLPPLFGIPISLKDVFHLQGRSATFGLISNVNKKEKQSMIISCFRNSGMIPFVQTNIPQFSMTMETANNLWGRSLNPWNKLRSTGGSSGGEGGMIALKCSLLGFGADIGGSIRIPSQFCGIFGLKPYSRRISDSCHATISLSLQCFARVIPNSVGPMAKSAEDLALLMLVATTESYYGRKDDPYTKIVPFDSHQFLKHVKPEKKFRIGIMKSIQDYEPTPASQRALKEVQQILASEGHEFVEISIPDEKQIIRAFSAEYLSSNAQNMRQMLKGEQPVGEYKGVLHMGQMNFVNRSILSAIAKLTKPRIYFYSYQKKPFKNVLEYQNHVGKFREFRNNWIDYWRQKNLDFVIAPGFGCQAFPHGGSQSTLLASAYTYLWNGLDMVAGMMPVTVVKEDEQKYVSRFNDAFTLAAKRFAEGSKGLPVGIQVIGLPYQDEKVLGIMSFLQKKLRFREKHPVPEPARESN